MWRGCREFGVEDGGVCVFACVYLDAFVFVCGAGASWCCGGVELRER
jgi:hypothetical protein